MIAIDDVDLCDPSSWEMIMAVVEANPQLILVMTMEDGRGTNVIPPSATQKLQIISLNALDIRSIAPLICQDYQAEAISSEIVK